MTYYVSIYERFGQLKDGLCIAYLCGYQVSQMNVVINNDGGIIVTNISGFLSLWLYSRMKNILYKQLNDLRTDDARSFYFS